MFNPDALVTYWKVGFKLVPLNELSKNPTIAWGGIYDNPNYWSIKKLKTSANTFYNLATTFGKTHLRDSQGRDLFLHCLDIDSEEVLKRILKFLEIWKLETFVTKTQKDCGYHVYWFEHNSENTPVHIDDCKKGSEFEIKCGKSLCTLPPSRHRDNPFFQYESIGQSDKIMISDGLYGKLVDNYLVTCLKRKKVSKLGSHNLLEENSNKMPQDQSNSYDLDPPSNDLSLTSTTILTNKQIEESVQCLLIYYKEKTRHLFIIAAGALTYSLLKAEK